MNRALIAVVALICLAGLTGCTFLTGPSGLYGSAGRTVPTDPSMCGLCGPGPGGPSGPTGPYHALALRGGGTLTDNVNDSYIAYGSFLVSGTESTVEIPVPVGGTLSNLEVFVATAPGTGASWTLTVDKNGSATVLTCSVAGAATNCRDSSLVAVAVGDALELRVTPFGTPELATITWSATLRP